MDRRHHSVVSVHQTNAKLNQSTDPFALSENAPLALIWQGAAALAASLCGQHLFERVPAEVLASLELLLGEAP